MTDSARAQFEKRIGADFYSQLLTRIRWLMGQEARRACESQDFAQRVLLELVRDPANYDLEKSVLIRKAVAIARNDVRDEVRRRRERSLSTLAQQNLDGRAKTPSRELVLSEETDTLIEALSDLSPEEQQVIELRNFEQLPFREIGLQMQRSTNAVQLLHMRCLTRIGEKLRSHKS